MTDELVAGYDKFFERFFTSGDLRFQHLAHGQRPKTLVIACSDSRVDPAIVFSAQPGDLFVVRNVANLVPPYVEDEGYHGTSSALEFAVCHLKVQQIVVLGHTGCAGIAALMNNNVRKKNFRFIGPWVEILAQARHITQEKFGAIQNVHSDLCCTQEAIKISIQNLLSFPFIKKAVDKHDMQIHAWIFDVTSGKMYMENKEGEFKAFSSAEDYTGPVLE